MRHDIQHFISNCLPCLRGDTKPIISNPAIALLILEIFYRIGIDLVFTINRRWVSWLFSNYRVLNKISMGCTN